MIEAKTRHLLVLGSGSAGQRHAANLSSLACRISCFDPRQDRVDELAEKTPCEVATTNLDKAFGIDDLDGVVICSPPRHHVEQAEKAILNGLPVLLEKPVSPDLQSAKSLLALSEKTGVPVLLGYTWRWWPPLMRVRELLDSRAIGPVRHVHFQMSAHLADWHPWERYQDFFMSSAELGGGALLDESHWTDLALWMFGKPRSVFARIDHLSNLEILSDDNVDMLWRYDSGLRVSIHLDIIGRPHEKYIRFCGDGGSLVWSPEPNCLKWGASPDRWDNTEKFDCQRNDMFVAVAKEFLDVLRGDKPSTCGLRDGVNVMQVIEAARRSNRDGTDQAFGVCA